MKCRCITARRNSKPIGRRCNASRGESCLERFPADHHGPDRAPRSLHKLYEAVHITTEVYNEVVIAGTGMPGASAVSQANWIRVSAVQDVDGLAKTILKTSLGAGEISAVFLAKELAADLTLMDEWKGRRLAIEAGLVVVGCVGILEELFRRGEIKDLRQIYQELLRQNIRVDLSTLQGSLKQFGLSGL